jgi:hypothetical protein
MMGACPRVAAGAIRPHAVHATVQDDRAVIAPS